MGAGSVDELAARLRALRAWAGDPSYTEIARRVGALRTARGVPVAEARPGRVTVYDVFRAGRSRLDVDLLADVAHVLGDRRPAAWRAAYRTATVPAAAPEPALPPSVRLGPIVPDGPLVGRADEVSRLAAALTAPPQESSRSERAS